MTRVRVVTVDNRRNAEYLPYWWICSSYQKQNLATLIVGCLHLMPIRFDGAVGRASGGGGKDKFAHDKNRQMSHRNVNDADFSIDVCLTELQVSLRLPKRRWVNGFSASFFGLFAHHLNSIAAQFFQCACCLWSMYTAFIDTCSEQQYWINALRLDFHSNEVNEQKKNARLNSLTNPWP